MNDSIRIALLGNITTDYLGREIQDICNAHGIDASIYNAPYNQYIQEVLDPCSGFYSFNPELTIIILEGFLLIGEIIHTFSSMNEKDSRQQFLKKILRELEELAEEIHRKSGSIVLINNFEIPYHTPDGVMDSKRTGLKRSVSALNMDLESFSCKKEFLYIFDYNGLCAHSGVGRTKDMKMYYLNKCPFYFPFMKVLAEEYMRYILPLKHRRKKCLVLDLDNTLWGGLAGEEGISGVRLDIDGTGRSYYDFQAEILRLFNRGVILAACSKNNYNDAMQIIEEHPHMLLRKKHFSALKINWEDKVSNIRKISEELSIGIDSMVFFDDNPVERDFVKAMLPELLTVDVPGDSSKYAEKLRSLVVFEDIEITGDDLKRNEMYAMNAKRSEFREKFCDLEEYLKSLEMKLLVKEANEFTFPRISQLTRKTNQFHLTGKRYQTSEIKHMSEAEDVIVLACSVGDRFGDNGVVGVCIARIKESSAFIDTFLLSCRVLGRNIEYAFLSAVVKLLREKDVETVYAVFVKTEKNRFNERFFSNAGFEAGVLQDTEANYVLRPGREVRTVDYIDVTVECI